MAADPHNEFVIAYHLIIDNKRITEAQNRIQINDFFVASSPPTSSFFMDMVSQFFVIFINCCFVVVALSNWKIFTHSQTLYM